VDKPVENGRTKAVKAPIGMDLRRREAWIAGLAMVNSGWHQKV